MKTFIPILIIIVLAVVAAVIYLRPETTASSDGPAGAVPAVTEMQPFPVEAAVASRRTLTRTIVASGRLLAGRRTDLSAGVGGRIQNVLVREGETVQKGQLLAQLEEERFRIQVDETRSALMDARYKYAFFITDTTAVTVPDTTWTHIKRTAWHEAQAAFERQEIDLAALQTARRDYEAVQLLSGDHRFELIAQNTGLTGAEIAHARAVLNLEQTSIFAPFSGVIDERLVEEGQQVAAGETCLTLLDVSRVRVKAAVLESDLGAVEIGRGIRVRVAAWPEESFEGKIARIYPAVDEESGTGFVEADLPNTDGRLKPGMYAEIWIEGTLYENRLAVPAGAVVVRDERPLVFRIRDGKAQWTYVTLGREVEGWQEITTGLAEGDTVAVTGNVTLAHDVPVRVSMIK